VIGGGFGSERDNKGVRPRWRGIGGSAGTVAGFGGEARARAHWSRQGAPWLQFYMQKGNWHLSRVSSFAVVETRVRWDRVTLLGAML